MLMFNNVRYGRLIFNKIQYYLAFSAEKPSFATVSYYKVL